MKAFLYRYKWHFLKLLIVGLIFTYLYKTGQLDIANFRGVWNRPDLFGMAVLLVILSTLISTQRWRVLLTAQGVFLGMLSAIRLSMIGYFFSTAIPGAVSGDMVKAYYLAKGKAEKERLVMSVIFDRFLGLYSMFLAASLAIMIIVVQSALSGHAGIWSNSDVKLLAIFICVIFLCLTMTWGLFMWEGFGRIRLIAYIRNRGPAHQTVAKMYDAMREYGRKPGLMLHAMSLSVVAQLFLYIGMWCLAILLEIGELSFLHYLFALPVGFVINAIPLAPGGLGVGEAGFRGIFLLFSSNKGAELAMLFHIIFFLLALGPGGILYLTSDFSKTKVT